MPADNLLEIKGLEKSFQEKKALDKVSFSLKEGEIFALLGPNGAGKTTLIRCILGFLNPNQGSILFQGKGLNPAAIKSSFGFLPENFFPYQNISAREFLELFGLGILKKNQAIELLAKMGLENAANNRVGTFSRGMVQRLGLASCLVGEPKILFLDDPLLGLDPIGQKELMQLILELKNQGKTVFFCSHILSQAEKICDRVGIILEGGLKFAGNLADFLSKHNTSSLEEAFFREIGQ